MVAKTRRRPATGFFVSVQNDGSPLLIEQILFPLRKINFSVILLVIKACRCARAFVSSD
jgi:hypothetical protein